MSTCGLEVGRAEVAVDEPGNVLVEPEPQQQVVAGDRVGWRDASGCRRRPGPMPARSRDARSSLHPVGSWARGGAPWSRCSSACRRASARRSARPGSGGRPARSGARSDGSLRRRRRSGDRRRAPRRPDPGLADERHPLALDGVEAHPQGGRLLLGDLADVGRLLVGRHRSPTDDPLRLADHQPGQVVAIHLSPRRREQVVRPLEPDLEAAERRLARGVARPHRPAPGWRRSARHASSTSPRRGSSPRGRRGPGASTVRARPSRSPHPRTGSPAGSRRRSTRGTPHPRRRDRRGEPPLDRAQPDALAPGQEPRAGRPGQDRAVERWRRQLEHPVGRAPDEEDVRGRRPPTGARRWSGTGRRPRRPGGPPAGRRRSRRATPS